LGELASLEPDDPAHFRDNGTLSERGLEVCYRLFDAGKTPLAVAYMMHVPSAQRSPGTRSGRRSAAPSGRRSNSRRDTRARSAGLRNVILRRAALF